jgi:zinc protease
MKTLIRPYTRKRLNGGPTLLVKERKEHPVVAVNFWVATGSVNEEPSLNGISHFYEHIFFKGTERYPQGEMDRRVKAMGGYNNAATSYEFTHYYIVAPKWHLAPAIDLLVDALLRPDIRAEDVERERQIIREEIRRRDDNPGARLFTLLQEEMFGGSAYALPILGREASLENIGAPELEAYHRTYYGLSSLTAVVVGDVEADRVERLLGESIERAGGGRPGGAGLREIDVPGLRRVRDRFEDKDINQVYAAVGFHTPGMREPERLPALEVAATILGGGKSSRLYKRLLEREELVSSISAWHMEMRRSGVFGIDTVFRLGRDREVNRCLFDEIGRFAEEGPSEDELHRARVMLETGFLFENETNAALSGTLGYYEVEFGSAEAAVHYREAIGAVCADDVRSVMKEYVDGHPFSRVVIGPEEARG